MVQNTASGDSGVCGTSKLGLFGYGGEDLEGLTLYFKIYLIFNFFSFKKQHINDHTILQSHI
jgi:hypothetical protein